MSPDTMLEAGWPAQMVDHAKAMAAVRRMAHLERGWYQDFSPRGGLYSRITAGGPVPEVAIREACEVIAWCAAHGVAAPSVYPTPIYDMTSGLSLEWDTPDVWAEWLAEGVWEVVGGASDNLNATTAGVCAALKGGV
jgi:hypothetical protein